jgi:hypothetical protein
MSLSPGGDSGGDGRWLSYAKSDTARHPMSGAPTYQSIFLHHSCSSRLQPLIPRTIQRRLSDFGARDPHRLHAIPIQLAPLLVLLRGRRGTTERVELATWDGDAALGFELRDLGAQGRSGRLSAILPVIQTSPTRSCEQRAQGEGGEAYIMAQSARRLIGG